MRNRTLVAALTAAAIALVGCQPAAAAEPASDGRQPSYRTATPWRPTAPTTSAADKQLAATILADTDATQVLGMAKTLVGGSLKSGAGSAYPQVWVRDFNTYLPLYFDAGGDRVPAMEALMSLLRLQRADGSIPDGYDLTHGTAFKNTVEADQESSLVQAFHTYFTRSGDWRLLDVGWDGRTVRGRLQAALEWVRQAHTSERYGLVWNGSTVDWGDIEAENDTVVLLGAQSHPALGVYTNAMYVLALKQMGTWPGVDQFKWTNRASWTAGNVRKFLWDGTKYRAHVYLDKGSPFPASFDESQVWVHGGTAVAIQAGLLTSAEAATQVAGIEANAQAAGLTVGLTTWPLYPSESFKGTGAMVQWDYQNGGDWDWFGGRLVAATVARDPAAAYRMLKPMLARVVAAGDFWEYWDRQGQGQHSGGFKGAAGVLGSAIIKLTRWAEAHRS